MSSMALPEITAQLCELLEPLPTEQRRRVITAALALLGEEQEGVSSPAAAIEGATAFGPNARRWMKQYGISEDLLEEVFYLNGGDVEIIANDVPGDSKRAKTQQCYLLVGVRQLLANDQPDFFDAEVVELCRNFGCYDGTNHATNRKDLGNRIRGSKQSGFSLPSPGLKAAAELVRSMGQSS